MNHVTRVLAIRHGETAWNVDTRIQGQLDIPLNDTGHWQAGRLAAAVADEGLHAIYASDLQRAHQTAQAIARATGLPITADKGLRERGFGSFEGHTYREIETRWPEESMRWRKREIDFSPGGVGESLRVFYDRCVNTAARLAAAHPGQTIAIVAHGGVMDCLYRAASRLDLQAARSWQLGNASINRLLYTPQGFSLVGWSDTSHLDQGSLDESNDRVGHAA
ncbi:histidine phosphatase family protein [Piscinibacter sp. HJYY11]|uniref:histidine phosphatase family protein n=1 Tax=Piscinibacter sp. HJYY11 TaxID=2801333 RepID=UPI00191C9A96|nr:histidine phosphatase family protein [Piscinibacter sp. HJYY11]MBL0728505.1 histidine phosphatase family protein [Piscinibacter sp. HJYY11]